MNDLPTPTPTIDPQAVLAALKEVTGGDWYHHDYAGRHEFNYYGLKGSAALEVAFAPADGEPQPWRWEHRRTLFDNGKTGDAGRRVYCCNGGRAVTPEGAATLARDFTPEAPVVVDGVEWHPGGEWGVRAPGTFVAVLSQDGEHGTIRSMGDGQFYWTRSSPLASSFVGLIQYTGLGYHHATDFSGSAETFEEAARKAANAPGLLMAAVNEWRSNPPRALPAGAGWAFLDACCGFTSVGTADDEEINAPTSPVVRAHLEAALGDRVPNQAWWTKRKGREGHAIAFAEYLEAVAGQLRADVKGA